MCAEASQLYRRPLDGTLAAHHVVVLLLCGLLAAAHSSLANEPSREVRTLPICCTWGGLAVDVVFLPDQPYIAVVAMGSRLSVVNLTNPLAPLLLGSFSFLTPQRDITDIAIQGDYVFVTSRPVGGILHTMSTPTDSRGTRDWTGFHVVDVSDPAQPRLAGNAPNFGMCQEIELYLEQASFHCWAFIRDCHWVEVFDITDPHAPSPLGEVLHDVLAMKVLGDYLYCLWQQDGLRIYHLGSLPLLCSARTPPDAGWRGAVSTRGQRRLVPRHRGRWRLCLL